MSPPERTFRLDELPQLPAVTTPGVLVLTGPGCVLPGLGHPSPTPPVLHVPTASPLRLDDLRATPDVAALTLTTGDIDTGTRLALSLAAHLRWLRSTRATDVGPIVTAAGSDETPAVAGLTKILHFATLHGAGEPVDRVVWEWTTPAAAVAWFGGQLPPVGDLHRRLDVLLWLRQLARERRLPETSASDEAIASLRDRYWSGRWLLENHRLVGRLVDDFDLLEIRP